MANPHFLVGCLFAKLLNYNTHKHDVIHSNLSNYMPTKRDRKITCLDYISWPYWNDLRSLFVCGRNIDIESDWENLGSHWNAGSGALHFPTPIFAYFMKLNQHCIRFQQTYFHSWIAEARSTLRIHCVLNFLCIHIFMCNLLVEQFQVYEIWDYVPSRKILQPLSHHLQQACWKLCLQIPSNDALTWMRALSIILHHYSIHWLKFHNIIQIHTNVLWDCQYFTEHSYTERGEYFVEYCQSHRALLWTWIMLCLCMLNMKQLNMNTMGGRVHPVSFIENNSSRLHLISVLKCKIYTLFQF